MSDEEAGVQISFGGDEIPPEVKAALDRHEQERREELERELARENEIRQAPDEFNSKDDSSIVDYNQKQKVQRIIILLRILFIVVAFLLGVGIASTLHWWTNDECETVTDGTGNNIDPTKETFYGIQFDLGSGGSRAYVYTWQEGGRMALGPPGGPAAWWIRIKGGVSSYSDPIEAAMSLSSLLDFCLKVLDEANIDTSKVPIFLSATAGMRALPDDEAAAIMEAVRDVVETYPFYFERDWARIVTGIEEGTDQWRSIQYLAASRSATPVNLCEFYGVGNYQLNCSSFTASTIGILGVGGQSVQTSYCHESTQEYPDTTDVSAMGYSNCKTLYVSSHFVGFDYANYTQTLSPLLEEAGPDFLQQDVKTLAHPCLHSGEEFTVEYKDGEDRHDIVLSGTSDYEGCLSLLQDLLKKVHKEAAPSIDPGMIFLSSGSHARRIREFLGLDFMYNPNKLKSRAFGFCSLDWQTAQSLYGKNKGSEVYDIYDDHHYHLRNYCPDALWYYSILERYGIIWSQNLVTPDIEGHTTDWTLAALLSNLPRYHEASSEGLLPALE
jgi:hypothetical protein